MRKEKQAIKKVNTFCFVICLFNSFYSTYLKLIYFYTKDLIRNFNGLYTKIHVMNTKKRLFNFNYKIFKTIYSVTLIY